MAKWGFLFVFALMLSGCAHLNLYPVMNFEDQPILDGVTPQAFQEAVIAGTVRRGWIFRRVTDGHLEGTLQVRSHSAVVDLRHTESTYSITYRDSMNLMFNGSEIHRNDNRWVVNLNRDIRAAMARASVDLEAEAPPLEELPAESSEL